ncbi:metabolite traffic protein EboE [Georgenia sp. 10Sc9-8]|uniref:Metabolite traffic protein EboE n=1 Tax=Georgenia halotolerans TaxID=3028317 RepID=A0ABT5TUH6_9MICO|nr:metabolite traffic protein EboE [Georgenia halotolerans]
MRFRHPDGSTVHVAYCTNVHPAEDVDGLREQLRRYAAPVRSALGVDRLGIGLWLPAAAAARLAADPAALTVFRQDLERLGLEVVTLNAFPYAHFHAPVVKHAVYHPDWTEPDRLAYTLDCARVLSVLLPDDAARGSISTLPLAWRTPWSAERDTAARDHLGRLADGLRALADETGRTVRTALEPEPGCVVETVADAVTHLGGIDTDVLGLCLDTCHAATSFEDPGAALAALEQAALPVVKAQVAAALHVPDPQDERTRAALADFVEDRFLHQVREQAGATLLSRDDLPEALSGPDPLPGDQPWRVHFHVPLHAEPDPPLRSTRDSLRPTLAGLLGGPHPRTDHLELETYTWSVLPPGQRPGDDTGLVAGLAAELGWVRDLLTDLSLEVL